MQSIRSLRSLPINAVVRRASFVKLGSCRLNSYCVIQKVSGASRLQQSVPMLAAFRVASHHFSLTNDESSLDLPVFDIGCKLVMKNGHPFTGCGQVNYPGGGIYTGAFVDGKKHGHGMCKYSNGDIYEGEWKNNYEDGDGIFTDSEGKIIRQGLFREGYLFTGKGRLRTTYGGLYQGELLEGQRHGQGKFTTKAGEVWEGEFRQGKPFNGKGSWLRKQGVWVEGVLTADEKESTTTLLSSKTTAKLPLLDVLGDTAVKDGQPFTGRGQAVHDEYTYSGEFVRGKKHGRGKISGKDGHEYEGEFKENVWDGQGRAVDAAGNISQGLFRDGKLFTGRGYFRYPYHSQYDGEVLEGQRHGQGKFTSKSGKVWEGEFIQGDAFTGKGCFGGREGVWVKGVFTAFTK